MKSVLIAEDNADLREIFARFFALRQFDVRVAHDGQAALTSLKTELPDVLILDLNMPRLTGFDVLRYMRGNPCMKPAKIIVVTGNMMALQAPEAEYADLFLVKPVDLHSLVEFADQLLSQ